MAGAAVKLKQEWNSTDHLNCSMPKPNKETNAPQVFLHVDDSVNTKHKN